MLGEDGLGMVVLAADDGAMEKAQEVTQEADDAPVASLHFSNFAKSDSTYNSVLKKKILFLHLL